VWPGAARIFADVDSPIALAFLARYPTAHSAARLGEKRLARFLVQHAYCGRRSPHELLARLHAAPSSPLGDSEPEAAGDLVRCLVAVLTPLGAQIQQPSAASSAALQQHPDAAVVQSLPRGGTINAAQILAELGDDRRRFTTADQLAAEAGVAPVTHASGKHHGVTFRWACNKRLRAALTTFADNSRHASVWAAAVYQHALARGCHHPHAIRILARAWVRVLWRCWQDRKPYDVTRHGAAVALAAA
jgi:transposase